VRVTSLRTRATESDHRCATAVKVRSERSCARSTNGSVRAHGLDQRLSWREDRGNLEPVWRVSTIAGHCRSPQWMSHQIYFRRDAPGYTRNVSNQRPARGSPPAFMRGGKSAQALRERVPSLITRFPGFPVQLGGSGAFLAAFLNESRIRGRVQCSVQEIRV
jgi:hypothetical protein